MKLFAIDTGGVRCQLSMSRPEKTIQVSK